jgi:hypothetical protein
MANEHLTLEQYLDEVWAVAWEKAAETTQEIFGNSETLLPDELELVFSPAFQKLTQPAKIQRLMEHRAASTNGPLTQMQNP